MSESVVDWADDGFDGWLEFVLVNAVLGIIILYLFLRGLVERLLAAAAVFAVIGSGGWLVYTWPGSRPIVLFLVAVVVLVSTLVAALVGVAHLQMRYGLFVDIREG